MYLNNDKETVSSEISYDTNTIDKQSQLTAFVLLYLLHNKALFQATIRGRSSIM